jgi:hypothetical protein
MLITRTKQTLTKKSDYSSKKIKQKNTRYAQTPLKEV